MSDTINDQTLINNIINDFSKLANNELAKKNNSFEHPLDKDIIEILKTINPQANKSIQYALISELDNLWIKLLEKAIICLRYSDDREPFIENPDKRVIAYGIKELQEYHERYTDFEGLLYGASSYYRDHIFHAIRTWMLGIFCLLDKSSDGMLIDNIEFDGEENNTFAGDTSFFEKISMWTIIALCHDLGYPLQKSQQILNKTKEMMSELIQNPNIWSNFGFTGIQDNINDYIVKFISTKMRQIEESKNEYYGRIQPKYYLKYAKSLEKFEHGIISSVIIFKMLLLFLESDFNLNDDYIYNKNDARQFYIRREILRAISSHTCTDIYNIHLTSFSSILFFCDELQEWGRKSWNELYAGVLPNSIDLIINKFNKSEIVITETVDMTKIEEMGIIEKNITRIFEKQYVYYKLKFRDGQYTETRDFNLTKTIIITAPRVKNGSKNNIIKIVFNMDSNGENKFRIDITEAAQYNGDFISSVKSLLNNSYYNNELEFITDNK